MPPASNVATLPTRPARPTLEIGGERRQRLESALLAMEIADSVDGMARAELSFGNWGGADGGGFQHFDRSVLEFGKAVVIKLGDDVVFDGRISAIGAEYPDGGPPKVSVLAEDRLQDLRMTRRTRVFENAGLADVARRVASDHGLTADVSFSGPTSKVVAQVNQSDLAFLLDLARREDAQIWVEGKTLKAAKTRPSDKVELRWAGSLREFRVEADLAGQRTAVSATGWDVADKAALAHKAEEGAVSSEVAGLDGGSAILRQAFAARADTLAHAVPRDAQEAKAIAEAAFRQQARRFVRGEGVAETSSGLRVGATVALAGLGPLFDGDYRATAVTHLFDNRDGQRSEFRCERPGLGRP